MDVVIWITKNPNAAFWAYLFVIQWHSYSSQNPANPEIFLGFLKEYVRNRLITPLPQLTVFLKDFALTIYV